MLTNSQAELGLADIDDSLADADRNIRQLGAMIPELESKGYPTDQVERELTVMTKALHSLRAKRHALMETLDGREPLPRIARARRHAPRRAPARPSPERAATLAATEVVATRDATTWRSIYLRLRGS